MANTVYSRCLESQSRILSVFIMPGQKGKKDRRDEQVPNPGPQGLLPLPPVTDVGLGRHEASFL